MPGAGEAYPGREVPGGLQMPRDDMLELARRAAEILVERMEKLPGERAWDGEFRDGLIKILAEDPPEEGRDAMDVLEQAAHGVLPWSLRLDHPRSFGFVPSSPT